MNKFNPESYTKQGKYNMTLSLRRKKTGSALVEFGPALFVFLIIIFFPLLDILGLAAAYGAGWYCNFLVTRELAVRRGVDGGLAAGATTGTSTGGNVANEVYQNLSTNSGMLNFVGIQSQQDLVHQVNYTAGPPPTVQCTTTIQAQPFIIIPFIGFDKKIPFTIASERPREVTN